MYSEFVYIQVQSNGNEATLIRQVYEKGRWAKRQMR